MSAIKKLTEEFIGAAQRNPDQATEIFRNAAKTYADLAAREKNPKTSKVLTDIGFEFVGAAAKAETKKILTTDFQQLLRDTDTAWTELGPAAASINAAMEATALERDNVISKTNDVSIQPLSFLNKDATLGRVASVTFNPTTEQKQVGIMPLQTVAFWQGSKRESQAMSVDFGTVLPLEQFVDDTTVLTDIIDARPYAVIQYGADGNTQNSVVVDVRAGRRLTVIGNYISVQVGMDPPRPQAAVPGATITSPVLAIGASISTFAAPSIAPVTRSVYIDQIAGGGSSPFIPIPLRAVQMLPPSPGYNTNTLQISFCSYSGSFIYDWLWTWSATAHPPSFPIPADAYFIRVGSTMAVPVPGSTEGIRIPFELSL